MLGILCERIACNPNRRPPRGTRDRRWGYYVNRAARLLAKVSEVRLRPLGMGAAYVPVLSMLSDGGRLAQRDLAARARIEQPTMAQLLNRMDRAGLIRRSPDPADGRSQLVSLTDLALSRLPDARAVLTRGHREATAGLSDRDVATLRRLLGRVIENLEAMDAEQGE